jgi:uncharacterized membrane protein
MLVKESSFAGHIPSPSMLESYGKIYPELPRNLVELFIEQARHRMKSETKVINTASRDSIIGIIFAGILGLAGILGGVYCVSLGYEKGGVGICSASFVTLAGTFVYGSKQNRKEREAKINKIKNQ